MRWGASSYQTDQQPHQHKHQWNNQRDGYAKPYHQQNGMKERKYYPNREQENTGKIELLKVQQQTPSQKPYNRNNYQNYNAGSYNHSVQQFGPILYPLPTLDSQTLQNSQRQNQMDQTQNQQFSLNSNPQVSISSQSCIITEKHMKLNSPQELSTPETPNHNNSLNTTQHPSESQCHASMFSTPKVNQQTSPNHQISLNCLRKCAQWNLAIKLNNKKLIKLPYTAVALRQTGTVVNGPNQFTQDILDALIQQETTNQCSQVPIINFSNSSQQNLHLKQFNGFIHKNQVVPVQLPLNNTTLPQSQCIDILKDYQSEQMFCLEFDLTKLPLKEQTEITQAMTDSENTACQSEVQDPLSEPNVRIINQQLVESTIHFFINGTCHGQKILCQDLHYQLQGKKIVKSVQQRIIDYKDHIMKQVQHKLTQIGSQCLCQHNGMYQYGQKCNHKHLLDIAQQLNYSNNIKQCINYVRQLNAQNYGPYLARTDLLHCKMLNITKSVAVEVTYQNLPNIENFLTNFNQLVLQEGVINKILFCFDLPLSKLLSQKLSTLIQQQQTPSQFTLLSPQHMVILKDSSQSKPPQQKEDNKLFNLLEEFQKTKVKEPTQFDDDVLFRSNSQTSNSTQSSNQDTFTQVTNNIQSLNQPIEQTTQRQVGIMPVQSLPIPQPIVYNYNPIVQQPVLYYHPQYFAPLANQQRQFILQQHQPSQLFQYNNHKSMNVIYDHTHPTTTAYQPPIPTQNIQPFQSNMDRLLKMTLPKMDTSADYFEMTIKDLFDQYVEPSIYGLNLLVQNQLFQEERLTFIPTLSSLLIWYNDNQQISKYDQMFEFHEIVPNYLRTPLSQTMETIFETRTDLASVKLCQISSDISWFAVVWSLLKSSPIAPYKKDRTHFTSDSSQCASSQQFLVVYKFSGSSSDSPIEVVGAIPMKQEDESFWIGAQINQDLQPTFDLLQKLEYYERKNRNRFDQMRDDAIRILEEEKTYDYNLFVNLNMPI